MSVAKLGSYSEILRSMQRQVPTNSNASAESRPAVASAPVKVQPSAPVVPVKPSVIPPPAVAKLGNFGELLRSMRQMVATSPRPNIPAASNPVKPTAPVSIPIPPSLGRDTYVPSPPIDPNSFFISQVRDPRWNPTASVGNANCGPTSLAMALRAMGMQPQGLTDPNDREAWIDQTRMAMEGDTNDFKLTSDNDILNGALRSGAHAEKVRGLQGVEAALAQGKLVVVAGNPVSYENRLNTAQYDHFDGGHFILVSAMQGDRVTIEDPQSHIGSFEISRAELQAYMAYKNWNVGVAVWKPEAPRVYQAAAPERR